MQRAGDGAGRGRGPRRAPRRGPMPLEEALRSRARSPRRSRRRTTRASSIATSSRPTSRSRPTATSRCSTSGWPRRSRAAAADRPPRAPTRPRSQRRRTTRAGMILGTAAYMSPEQATRHGRRQARRHLVVRRGAVRDADRPAAVRGRDHRRTRWPRCSSASIDWTPLPAATPPRPAAARALPRARPKRACTPSATRAWCIEDCSARSRASSGQRSLPAPALAQAAASATRSAVGDCRGGARRPDRVARPALALSAAPSRRNRRCASDVEWCAEAPLSPASVRALELSPDGSGSPSSRGPTQAAELYCGARPARRARPRRGLGHRRRPTIRSSRPTAVDRLRHRRGDAQDAGRRRHAARALQGHAQPRRHLASPTDTIVFAATPVSGLFRVPAAGGEPQPLTTLDEAKKEATHRWPQVLPGGKEVLFTSHTPATADFDNATIEVVDRRRPASARSCTAAAPTGATCRRVTWCSSTRRRCSPCRSISRGSSSRARRRRSCRTSSRTRREGGAQFAFSATGVLALPARRTRGGQVPGGLGRSPGRHHAAARRAGRLRQPRLSPDGRRLALTVMRDGNWDIWVYDLERGVPTRLTFDDGADTEQVWSPDGGSSFQLRSRQAPTTSTASAPTARARRAPDRERPSHLGEHVVAGWSHPRLCRDGSQGQFRHRQSVSGRQQVQPLLTSTVPRGRSGDFTGRAVARVHLR